MGKSIRLFRSTVSGVGSESSLLPGAPDVGFGIGIGGWKIKLVDTDVTGNYMAGVYDHRARLVLQGSTAITGNDVGAGCGTQWDCPDIATARLPRVKAGALCGTSAMTPVAVHWNERIALGAEPWGVCAAD